MEKFTSESIKNWLASGELWMARYEPRDGFSEEDIENARRFAEKHGVKFFIYEGVAMVFYKDEDKLDYIKERVKENLRI